MLFPIISGVCCLIVLGSFAIPAIMSKSWLPPDVGTSSSSRMACYAVLFLFYFCNYFIMVFFNAAIVACVTIRMKGGDPSVSDGLRAAFARLPLIAGWALVQATVGLILRIIEDRSEMIGKIVAGLIGLAWTLTSFLVIPVLVVEEKGPLAALEESTTLLKKTWGEQLIGNFSFGLVFFALSIPAFVFIVLGFASGRTGMIVAVILAAAYLIGLGLIQSALQAIFQSALYMYVRNGQVPPGFQADLLDNAIMQK